MDLQNHLLTLRARVKSKVGNIIAGYELEKWPNGRLDELLDKGVLKSLPLATTIRCPCCGERCPGITPIKETANDGSEYYMIICEKEGCRDIPESYLHRWQITDKIHEIVNHKQKRNRLRSSELTVKQRQAYQLIHIGGKSAAQAAFEMHCTVQNVSKLLKIAERKIDLSSSRSVGLSEAQRLPEDNRGQSVVSAD